jgi:hypothetical protein
LHEKFVVFDDRVVLGGSVNLTSSGIYYNDELLYIFEQTSQVRRHVEIFYELWNSRGSTSWENVILFSSHDGHFDRNLVYKKIAEAITGFFYSNGNQAVLKSVLCEQIARTGFEKDDVIEVAKALYQDGVLYEPKPDMLKKP